MPSRLAENIVSFLGHGKGGGIVSTLAGFSARRWKRALPWLDSSGLALYLLNRIDDLNAGELIPNSVLARLRQNQGDNRDRTLALLDEMRVIQERFFARGVEFAVLKGYSLVPEYCPAAALRHQCDLDYLVACDHLDRAGHILHSMGYSRVRRSPRTFTYSRSTGELPSRDAIYQPALNYSVELHTSLWDNDDVAVLEALPQVLKRRQFHQASGLVFPVLAPEDRFIHQCMHVLSHTLQFWIRLAWLYEIANFLGRPSTDAAFWRLVEKRIGNREYIAKAVHLVTLLAARIFSIDTPVPRAGDYPFLELWINEYGSRWAPHDLPGSKLSLFLFPEFMNQAKWRRLERQRLFPVHRPHAATQLDAAEPRRSIRAQVAEYFYASQRLKFHVREAAFYFREKPRWQLRLEFLRQNSACNQSQAVLR
ncbi:MAG TPA: nucleotidyltransferase family protein [Terriglobales bacterium]|nr:nucleotidyltransferase family protein [Terriglobales bacterium]